MSTWRRSGSLPGTPEFNLQATGRQLESPYLPLESPAESGNSGTQTPNLSEVSTFGGISPFQYRPRHEPSRKAKQVAEKQQEISINDNKSSFLPKDTPKKRTKTILKSDVAKAYQDVKAANQRLHNAEQAIIEMQRQADEANLRLIAYLEAQELEMEEEEQVIVALLMELL